MLYTVFVTALVPFPSHMNVTFSSVRRIDLLLYQVYAQIFAPVSYILLTVHLVTNSC